MVGYFNLKEGKLYTRDNSLKHSDNVVVVEKVASNAIPAGTNIMELVKNSYNYRFEELNGEKHHIEEAEGCECKYKKATKDKPEEITSEIYYFKEYCANFDEPELYPLETKDSKKAENIFSDYKLFKGGSK